MGSLLPAFRFWLSSGGVVVRGIGEDFKEQVRASTSLVDLVSEIVALKPQRGGTDYVGLCPFHEDRNPSFHVYPERQTYRCWVCDLGGDCFRWVMDTEKVTFPEALESLARRANLTMPASRRSDRGPSEQSRSDRYAVMEWAAGLMHQSLRTAAETSGVRQYLQQRGLSDSTVRAFRIGYHPEDWNWFLEKAAGRFTPQQLLAAGLIREHRSGTGYFDNQLTGRLVFPIADERGRPVAFGGRVIPGSNIQSEAKYWNSVESAIFHKRRMLYAFDRAREPMRRSGSAIVVEGYMDCIACHQAGADNVVATLGTSLTEEHVRFLKRFVRQVVLLFDGDDAGQRAAERSISRFLAQDLDLRILTLPDGKDPADFFETSTLEDFHARLAQAPEAWEYKLHNLIARTSTDTVSGREQVLHEMLAFMKDSPGLSGTVREDLILKTVCWRLQADERTARRQLGQVRETGQRYRQRTEAIRPQDDAGLPITETAQHRAERELLEIILLSPETIDAIQQHVGVDDFEHPQYRRLLGLCLDLWKEDGELPELDRVVSACDSDAALLGLTNAILDSAEHKQIARLLAESMADDEPSVTGLPPHLERVLCPLVERREKKLQIKSKERIAQSGSTAMSLDSETREALSRLYSFRKTQMGHPSAMK